MNSAVHNTSFTALHTIQNEWPEPACVIVCLDSPEMNVKISYEVEVWHTRTVNCSALNDHWTIEYDFRQRPKTWKIVENKKISCGHNLPPETEDMSGKTWNFGNPSVDRLVHKCRQVSVYGCEYTD
jgi:hypothetical protein